MSNPKQPQFNFPGQTLDVGEYFVTNDIHKGGYYKVEAKVGCIYFVYCNLRLEPGCHGNFRGTEGNEPWCPFPDDKEKCEKEDCKILVASTTSHTKPGGCHHTCMILNPERVKKIPQLKGLMDLGK